MLRSITARKTQIFTVFTLLLTLSTTVSSAQPHTRAADSIRKAFDIPALAYAIVSGDSILELKNLGARKVNTAMECNNYDLFRIGSNTKAITGMLAAMLVKEGKISWGTHFFDLFPEMSATARKEHLNLTLLDLLTFRTKLYPYTYTYKRPKRAQFSGDATAQRRQFANWFFQQPPVARRDSICFSNLGYVAAGLMLEKASGKIYKQLVADLGEKLGITFQFGQPNAIDVNQVWGHDASLTPEPPADNYKLNWLEAAGNITMTLPDYSRLIQYNLKGLEHGTPHLSREDYNFMHFGRARFALGWFWDTDDAGNRYSWNVGNPGTFLTKVYVYPHADRAIIIFSNAQTDMADEGTDALLELLRKG
ncbi:MAG: beta-lactamase family protein [Taibaiella sp.]|nr:beta-lactamase family protein [Taibaiella sp.]